METIDEEDQLTLIITQPNDSGFNKVGEIRINILDLLNNKRK